MKQILQHIQNIFLTCTAGAIPTVSRVAGTGEAPHSVGTVSISVTVISISSTLTNIYQYRHEEYRMIEESHFDSLPLQVKPSPVNPSRQVQVKLSAVSAHCALALQLAVPSEHSFTAVWKYHLYYPIAALGMEWVTWWSGRSGSWRCTGRSSSWNS